MRSVIEIKDLHKKYGSFEAVKGISFEVKAHEVFGLLGENGAGKTTTLEIIEGLRRPTSGQIKVLGHDLSEISQIKEKIGIQLQSSAYYNFLTLREILYLFGKFFHKQLNADELLAMVDLTEKADEYLNELSGGQKQRFSIVASLVNDPQIVFLDEPTTGLDPNARRTVWEIIERIKAKGKTIILTTHYMEEAERLCDRIAIMDAGQILVLDDTASLLKTAKYPNTVEFKSNKFSQDLQNKIQKMADLQLLPEDIIKIFLHKTDDLKEILNLILPLNPRDLKVGHATLEDLFIELTGKSLVN